MKKLLLSFTLVLTFCSVQSQNLIMENFDNITTLPAAGWQTTNQSAPLGSTVWFQGGAGTTFAGYNGGQTSYIGANFNATTGSGTISNWLITPVLSLQNGDVVTFWTRKTTYPAAPSPSNTFPDRLEVRLSTNGGFTANPSTGISDLGDFTTLILSINPDLALTGYPGVWTQYTYTVSGLTGVTDSKLAFRYWVTNGGPTGANSDFIGIDAFSVDRPLATADFFAQNFAVYPNPADNVLNISSKNNISLNQVQLTDLNGRIVKNVNTESISTAQINIGELNAGVYFLKVTSAQGSGTTKIIKK